MQEKTELRDILKILRSRLWLIIAITAAAALTSGLVSYCLLPRIYRSSTTLMVYRKESAAPLDYTTMLLNRQLVKTYSKIALSRTVAEAVVRELALPVTPEEVSRKIKVDTLGETEIIQIDVEDTNPVRAQVIAVKAAEVFIRQVRLVMNAEDVQVIDPAVINNTPVKPRLKLNILTGLLLGLLTGLGIAFFTEYLDNTIKTPEDVYDCLQVPVLGSIPRIDAAYELRQARILEGETGLAAPVRTEEGKTDE